MLSTMHTVQLHDLQATIDRATSTAPVRTRSVHHGTRNPLCQLRVIPTACV